MIVTRTQRLTDLCPNCGTCHWCAKRVDQETWYACLFPTPGASFAGKVALMHSCPAWSPAHPNRGEPRTGGEYCGPFTEAGAAKARAAWENEQ